MENPRYGGQMQQAEGVDSLVRDSFDSWSATLISVQCTWTVISQFNSFVFIVLANNESGVEKFN